MRHAVLALAVLATACGDPSAALTTSDVRNFNVAAQDVSAAEATYGTAAAAMTDPVSCGSAETSYDAQVRPMVAQLKRMGTAMDAKMGSMGFPSDGDMDCAAGAMTTELDRHQGAACASPADMAPNKAEAQQHVTTMVQWANHQLARSHDLGSEMGMGMGGMSGGGVSTGHCVHNADGSYTMAP